MTAAESETTAMQPAGRRRPSRRAELLRRNWRTLSALALLVAGVTFVLLAWYGAAYTNILTEQIPYLISGGLLGLGLIIVAGFLASSASIERETQELRRELARALDGLRTAEARPGGPASEPAGADGRVFVVPGGKSYHVAGCPILEGKDGVRTLAAGEAAGSGYAICKLCGP